MSNHVVSPRARGARSTLSSSTYPAASSTTTTSSSSAAAASGSSASNGRTVLIHVFDEYRKSAKDFVCNRDVLLAKMKYFQTYLNASNAHDEIDISVHCDIEIFEWLVQYMQQSESEWKPRLALDTVASILVSSEFLQMDALVDECVLFVTARMQAFVQLRVDFSCLSDATLGKIADRCSAEELQALHDPKDKILSKLQKKKLEAYIASLCSSNSSAIVRCATCSAIYLHTSANVLSCPSGKRQIGIHGELVARHEPRTDWHIDDFVRDATSDKRVTWSALYWFVWASTNCFFCGTCKRHFAFAALHACAYHPGQVTGFGQDAKFACCSAGVFDGDDLSSSSCGGCCTREHVPLFSDADAASEQRFDAVTKVPGLWDLIRSCERAVMPSTTSAPSPASPISSASLRLAMLQQLLHGDQHDVPSPSLVSPALMSKRPATAAASSAGSGDPNSPLRRQWRALQLQEKDRVRHQLLARRLLQMRKNLTT